MPKVVSELDKILRAAEDALRQSRELEVDEVASISKYWLVHSLENAVKYARDVQLEDGTAKKDFFVVERSVGELQPPTFRIVQDATEKWKILHEVEETKDDKLRPWLRALRRRTGDSTAS